MKKEHTLIVKEVSYMIDQTFCTCGWSSDRFWDGYEWAINQWRDHVRKATKPRGGGFDNHVKLVL